MATQWITRRRRARVLGATGKNAVVLDLGLPSMDQVDAVAAGVRPVAAPVLAHNARPREGVGINSGADDYVQAVSDRRGAARVAIAHPASERPGGAGALRAEPSFSTRAARVTVRRSGG
jgi:hypothetical protein